MVTETGRKLPLGPTASAVCGNVAERSSPSLHVVGRVLGGRMPCASGPQTIACSDGRCRAGFDDPWEYKTGADVLGDVGISNNDFGDTVEAVVDLLRPHWLFYDYSGRGNLTRSR